MVNSQLTIKEKALHVGFTQKPSSQEKKHLLSNNRLDIILTDTASTTSNPTSMEHHGNVSSVAIKNHKK